MLCSPCQSRISLYLHCRCIYINFNLRARAPTQGTRALQVLRCKNKFAFEEEELKGGYRDLMLSVLYEDPVCGLRIIGEIQVRACIQVDRHRNAHIMMRERGGGGERERLTYTHRH